MSDDMSGPPVDGAPTLAALGLIDAGRADEAIGVLGRFLAEHPTDVTTLGLLSLAHLRARRWAEALRVADQAIGLDPGHLPAWQRRSIALIELDRTTEAQEAAAEYLRLAPDDWHAHYTMARVLRPVRGRRQQALWHASRAVELAPQNADAHNLLGAVYRAIEDRANAERAYRTALAIDPSHALARSNLALSTLGRVGTDEVLAGLSAAAASDPQQLVIHRNMALVAVLGLVRRAARVALIDLMVVGFVLSSTQRSGAVATRLVVLGLVVVGWAALVGWWRGRLARYLRSLVPGAVRTLLGATDGWWGPAGIVCAVVCACAALLWPSAGLPFVVAGYLLHAAGSWISRGLAARDRRRAASDRA
jgi:Flp pilus assembly protein TadD